MSKAKWSPDICVYHGNCQDGFGAAWAIWSRWQKCEFRPGFYGKPLPLDDAHGKNVLFVDFTGSAVQLEAVGSIASSVVVIDHHKTAEEALSVYRPTLPMEHFEIDLDTLRANDEKPIIAFFDMNRSGAVLAWMFAFTDKPVPRLLQHIEDRDLWVFRYGEKTRDITAGLRSYPMEFDVWQELRFELDRLEDEGRAVRRIEAKLIESLVHEHYFQNIGGFQVPVTNAPYKLASETANALLKLHPDAPFAATWTRTGDGKVAWSLRSELERGDVSAIARQFGGGGHRNAAGFAESANV